MGTNVEVRRAWRARHRERINAEAREAWRRKQDERGVTPRVQYIRAFQERVSVLDVAQRAYLAGLVDGEGCVFIAKERGRPSTVSPWYTGSLSISMTTTEPLRTIASWLGLSVREYANIGRKPTYSVATRGLRAVAVLTAVRPYLLLKRPQADLVIQLESTRPREYGGKALAPEVIASQEAIWRQFQGMNTNKGGHLAARSGSY